MPDGVAQALPEIIEEAAENTGNAPVEGAPAGPEANVPAEQPQQAAPAEAQNVPVEQPQQAAPADQSKSGIPGIPGSEDFPACRKELAKKLKSNFADNVKFTGYNYGDLKIKLPDDEELNVLIDDTDGEAYALHNGTMLNITDDGITGSQEIETAIKKYGKKSASNNNDGQAPAENGDPQLTLEQMQEQLKAKGGDGGAGLSPTGKEFYKKLKKCYNSYVQVWTDDKVINITMPKGYKNQDDYTIKILDLSDDENDMFAMNGSVLNFDGSFIENNKPLNDAFQAFGAEGGGDQHIELHSTLGKDNSQPNEEPGSNKTVKPVGKKSEADPKKLGSDNNKIAPDPNKTAPSDDNINNKRVKLDEDTIEETRKAVLKKKLVTDYKKKKEEDKFDSVDSADIKHTSNPKTLDKVDLASYGFTAGSVLGAAGATVADKLTDTDTASDITGAVGAGLGATANVMKLSTNFHRLRKSKNRRIREVAKYKGAAGTFGAAQSITGGLSNGANLGMFGSDGKVDGTTGKTIGGALDIASGATGFVSNMLDYFGDRKEKALHKDTAEKTKKLYKDNSDKSKTSLASSREKLKELKDKGFSNLSTLEKVDFKRERQKRHTAKAQLLAMEQAETMHRHRSEENKKGLLSAIGGGVGLLGSVATGISKIMGNAGGFGSILKMAGSALGAVGAGLKGLNFAKGTVKEGFIDDKQKREHDKKHFVQRYVDNDKKIAKIKDQAQSMTLSESEERALGDKGRKLSLSETWAVAVARLGVDVPIENDAFTDDVYEQAFQKISEKRANNILQSSEKEKNQMLDALGLDHDAHFEEVVAALGGE